jgi:hypothetical protein
MAFSPENFLFGEPIAAREQGFHYFDFLFHLFMDLRDDKKMTGF